MKVTSKIYIIMLLLWIVFSLPVSMFIKYEIENSFYGSDLELLFDSKQTALMFFVGLLCLFPFVIVFKGFLLDVECNKKNKLKSGEKHE